MTEKNIRLVIEYEGTRYHGWQSQDNAITVQDTLEKAIEQFSQERVRVIAAGRTDAGVHARGQVVNFRMKKTHPSHKILMAINSYLPEDIVVRKVDEVPFAFHSRFSAIRRVYQYYIRFEKTAIYRNYCWQIFQKIDTQTLPLLAEFLLGENDFSAFSRLDTQTQSKICHIYESSWKTENDFLIYRIVGNRFLHGMVRTIVGTMIDVARKKITSEQFISIFQSGDRNLAGESAPAKGLILEEIIY